MVGWVLLVASTLTTGAAGPAVSMTTSLALASLVALPAPSVACATTSYVPSASVCPATFKSSVQVPPAVVSAASTPNVYVTPFTVTVKPPAASVSS